MPAEDKQAWKGKFQRRMELLREYEHQTCGTITAVSDDITRKSVLDPYYYGLETTFCAGCRNFVPARECFLENGQTLFETTVKLRKHAPTAFKIVRFVITPLAAGFAGGVLGYLLTGYLAIGVAGALIGLLLGYFLLSRLVATVLRGSGLLWE